MAVTMDDDMAIDAIDMDNMDDLFGEGGVGIMSEASPPTKVLVDRIEELRSGGCQQTVAWSRQGSIASITSKGDLEIQSLRIDPRDGSWGLSEPTLVPDVGTRSPLSQVPLKHLSWASNGSDLAAIDAAGRVAILSVSSRINEPASARNIMQDSVNELHAVVGSVWLNPASLVPGQPTLHTMAVRTSSQGYRYEAVTADAFGPSYPLSQTMRQKTAFICVTTGGLLRLFWPKDTYSWTETTAEIESIVSSDDLITHASMCADKDKTLLLSYATSSNQLRVVRIAIQWTMPPAPNQKEQTPQLPVRPPSHATIRVTHLTSTNCMDSIGDLGGSHLSPAAPAISHLRMLSPCRTGRPDGIGLPVVIAVRTHLPTNTPLYDQEIHNLIERWEIRPTTPRIHPAFQQLSSRRDSVGSKKTTSPTETFFLKKLDSKSSKKVMVWMDTIQLDRVLVLGYHDGSIDFVFRDSLDTISSKGGLDSFCHLTQAGFLFRDMEPSISGALSPCGIAAAYKTADGKVKWKGLLHTSNDMSSPSADTHYEASVAGLTMPALKEWMQQFSGDDVLAVADQFKGIQGRNVSHDIASEICKNIKVHCDFSEQEHHEALIHNQHIPMTLGVILAQGYNGEASHRSFSSTIAWMTLQLRSCVLTMTAFTRVFEIPAAGRVHKMTGTTDPEALREIAGTVRWSLDLMAWIIDCLIHPNDPGEFDETFNRITKAKPLDLAILNNYLHSTKNVALHILLSSVPRGLLLTMCNRLHHVDYTARLNLNHETTNLAALANGVVPARHLSSSLRAAFTSIGHLTGHSVVPYSQFKEFLMKTAGHAKEVYIQAGLPANNSTSAPARNLIEQQILFGGELPQQSAYAVGKIFHEDLPALKAAIDPAKLFFHDFSVLGLPLQDRGTNLPYVYLEATDKAVKESLRQRYANYRIKHTVDVYQRKLVVLGNEGEEQVDAQKRTRRWRRCVRCAAVMEDVLLEDLTRRNPAVISMIKMQTRCHCLGLWSIMSGKKCIP